VAEDRYQDEPRAPRSRRPRRDEEEYEEEERPRRRSRRDEDDDLDVRRRDSSGLDSLIPYKNPKALVAYYCGVFSLIPCLGAVLGPIALILGILGLKYGASHPTAGGAGHAWAGIVLGSLVALAHAGVVVFLIIAVASR
jgi:hypothetical protein